jgi:hypothetical protein
MSELVRAVNPEVAFADGDLHSIIDNVWSAYAAYVQDKVHAGAPPGGWRTGAALALAAQPPAGSC